MVTLVSAELCSEAGTCAYIIEHGALLKILEMTNRVEISHAVSIHPSVCVSTLQAFVFTQCLWCQMHSHTVLRATIGRHGVSPSILVLFARQE